METATPPHVHSGSCCSHDHSDEIKIYKLSTQTKLDSCDGFKMTGLGLFHECQFKPAQTWFQKIIVYLDYTFAGSPGEELRCDELRTSALINLCVCSVKLREFAQAVKLADQVLRENDKDAKALYCRAKSRRELGELELAREDAVRGLGLLPSNRDLQRELGLIADAEQRYRERSKEMALGMFAEPASGVDSSSRLVYL
ncbi:hypothetical protein BASA81_006713 [Batrachochytrium salamandrivorans]|nr:hypothetical protein BASA81_006713 [Batrachochytrium salamandrivorans]